MVKTRNDFKTEKGYREYVATNEFKEQYSIKDKTMDEVVDDMMLPHEWMPYIKKVYEENMQKGRYEGIYFYHDVEQLVIDDEDYEANFDKRYQKKRVSNE